MKKNGLTRWSVMLSFSNGKRWTGVRHEVQTRSATNAITIAANRTRAIAKRPPGEIVRVTLIKL